MRVDRVLQFVVHAANQPGVFELFLGLVTLLFAAQLAEAWVVFSSRRKSRFQIVVVRLAGGFFAVMGALRLAGTVHI